MAGIFIGTRLDPISVRLIQHYVRGLDLPAGCKLLPASELHITIMYCKTPNTDLTWRNYPKDPTPTLGFAYQLRYIGKALAIIVESKWIRQRFAMAKMLGLRSDFPGMIPHCSIAYDLPTNLPIADFPQPWKLPIAMTGEYTEALKE